MSSQRFILALASAILLASPATSFAASSKKSCSGVEKRYTTVVKNSTNRMDAIISNYYGTIVARAQDADQFTIDIAAMRAQLYALNRALPRNPDTAEEINQEIKELNEKLAATLASQGPVLAEYDRQIAGYRGEFSSAFTPIDTARARYQSEIKTCTGKKKAKKNIVADQTRDIFLKDLVCNSEAGTALDTELVFAQMSQEYDTYGNSVNSVKEQQLAALNAQLNQVELSLKKPISETEKKSLEEKKHELTESKLQLIDQYDSLLNSEIGTLTDRSIAREESFLDSNGLLWNTTSLERTFKSCGIDLDEVLG